VISRARPSISIVPRNSVRGGFAPLRYIPESFAISKSAFRTSRPPPGGSFPTLWDHQELRAIIRRERGGQESEISGIASISQSSSTHFIGNHRNRVDRMQ
jgi:hypothetical protein